MKKNLFGAVAVGLALALAFTACESGNDDPVKLAYTRANYGYDPAAAAENEDVFTYSAAPTNILYNTPVTTGLLTDAALTGSDAAGYELSGLGARSYVKGVQSFNRRTGEWNVKSTPVAGLVYNTISELITFDPADGTFVRNGLVTEMEIKQIDFLTSTQIANLHAPDSYLLVAGESDNDTIGEIINHYTPADEEYNVAWSWREGARYAIYVTVTTVDDDGNLETTGNVTYVSSLKSDAVVYYSAELAALVTHTALEPAMSATGTFSISGNFANGKILLTSWVTADGLDYEFNDKAGTYVNKALTLNNPVKGDIDRDFPEKSRIVTDPSIADTASEFCKTGRTLNIKNKVLTANKIQTNLSGNYNYVGLLSYQNPEYRATPTLYAEDAESYKYGLVD